MIDIVKASAGSGKTFLLARTYIEQLLSSDDKAAYRHILAVTFTNKATAEMKNRILKELDILARDPEKSDYWKDFCPKYGPADRLKIKASEILSSILHDYSAFAISTIDHFFQRTLKAFAREIGHFASYQVELDKTSLVHETVDRILDSITESDTDMLSWLTDSVMEQIGQKGYFNLATPMYTTAIALKSDSHRELVEKQGLDTSRIYSKDYLKSVRKACLDLKKQYFEDLHSACDAVDGALSSAGLTGDDFKSGFVSKMISKVRKGLDTKQVEVPTDKRLEDCCNPDSWFAKTKQNLLAVALPALEAPLADFADLFGEKYKAYNTADIILGQLYSLGIASVLSNEFDALLKEKNVLSLDESNTILRRIIDGSDAPFVYEKLGVRFEHFLLDEFQDTSAIQWENFRPLIAESNAAGNRNLIVGDEKQSIYRWRGSDWELLGEKVQEEFSSAATVSSLESNWRSLRNIVDFNNAFYSFAAQSLDQEYSAKSGRTSDLVSRIYSGHIQKAESKDVNPGGVRIDFVDKEDSGKDRQLELIINSIHKALENGAAYGDVAILVRGNDDAALVASALSENRIPVVSDDSLNAKSSVMVRRLVSLMECVLKEGQRKVTTYLAEQVGLDIPEGYHSLDDLAQTCYRSLEARYPDECACEVLYLDTFLDELHHWGSVNGNDLSSFLQFWKEHNSMVSSPLDKDAVTVMTIHKSKGLEFPYVILPFAERITLFKSSEHWTSPSLKDSPLQGKAEGTYHVNLSDKTLSTFFRDDYLTELQKSYIDNINILYVATTRAEKYLHIISNSPQKTFSNMSTALYRFLEEEGMRLAFTEVDGGYELGQCTSLKGKDKPSVESIELVHASYPENGRLKLSEDSQDFFSDEGVGVDASVRLKGTVLHRVLSKVISPSDLDNAIADEVISGSMASSQAEEAMPLLRKAIDFGLEKGWFPDDKSKVRNEVSIVDSDGMVYRPDRIVLDGDKVIVIDYKFGHPDEHQRVKYRRQVNLYAELYRRMGFDKVESHLWYVEEGVAE